MKEQRIFAHQLLIDAEVFRDREFGARSCRLCNNATLNRAGEVARLIVTHEESGKTPSVRTVRWDTDRDIVGEFSAAIRIAHSRHASV